jgi:hypothetical protein
MKRTISYATVALAAGVLLGLAACDGRNDSTVPAAGVSVVQIPQSHGRDGRAKPLGPTLAVSSCGPCYTYTNSPSSESLYAADGTTLRRTVSNGIAAPWVGLVFDASGDLFVANCSTCLTGQTGTNNVVELEPHTNTPAVTITNGIKYPFDLAVDSSGTLYASNLGCYSPSCSGSVSEYPAGYTSGNPSATIQVRYPLGLALDSAKNLYVANCVVCSTGTQGSDQVLVYAPGATTPMQTITTGINEPVAMAVDSSNNLYVANCLNCGLGAGAYVSGTDTVTEYASGSPTPTKTITFSGSGADIPFSLAVDQSGDLFVGNAGANSVTEYPPNATTPSKTITNGVSAPVSLAIDARGVLHVSNSGGGSTGTVTEYPANYKVSNPPKHTLTVAHPSSIAVSN